MKSILVINQTNDVELPVDIRIPNEELSFCLSLRFGETIVNVEPLGNLGKELWFKPSFELNYGWIGIDSLLFIFLMPENHGVQPLTWFPFCFTSNQTHYQVACQGKLWYQSVRSDDQNIQDTLIHKITFKKLKEQASDMTTLELSKLNIWSTFMNVKELLHFSKTCQQDTDGDILSWNGISDQLANLSSSSITEQDEDNVCSTFTEKITQPLHVSLDFNASQKACQILGGQVWFPGWTYESYAAIPWHKINQSLCKLEIWTPLRKMSIQNYHLLSTNTTLKYSKDWPWRHESFEPNGGLEQKCIGMTSKGLSDYGCHLNFCPFCEFERNVGFTLLGLCEGSEIDDQYLMIPSAALTNNFASFKGFTKNIIKKVGENWQIIDTRNQLVLGESEPINRPPVGKYRWNLFDPKCNGTKKLKLTKVVFFKEYLTNRKEVFIFQCNGQYTCDDGDCIDLEKVCDTHFDCDDHSDEFFCKTCHFDERKYAKHFPPFTSTHKAKVYVKISIISMSKIDEVEMTFGSKFFMQLKWLDLRLNYKHILGYHKNLARESADKIWLPSLSLSTALGTPNVLNSDSFMVKILQEGVPKSSNKKQLDESWIFKGSENPLVFSDIRDETFACDFELTHYPFDHQICTLELEVIPSKRSVVELIPEKCQIKEDIQLTQFEIVGIDTRKAPNNYTFACEIVLKRNPAFHIVSTYLPTLTLMMMALGTLFIDESHIEATIMVAMTSMLVMFTLHQNVQSSVPYTAYLKFVDYWLIFGTILPFVVFIVEIAWELGMGDKKTQNQVQRLNEKNYYKIVPMIGLPFLTFLFVICYTFIALYLQYQ